MSKAMKMTDYFPKAFEVTHNKSFEVQNCHWVTFGEDFHSNCDQDDAISHAVLNYDHLVEENAALREALRLKELECEVLAHDKSVLLSFVNLCAGHQGCSADSMSFFALTNEAAQLWGELGGGDENQQAD